MPEKVLKKSDLLKLCKEKKLKGYSKLNKAGLEHLLKTYADKSPPITYTVKELRKLCKTHNVLGCYKLKKKELEHVLKDHLKLSSKNKQEKDQQNKSKQKEVVKEKQKSKKKEISKKFDRQKKIEEMKAKVEQHYDPVYFDPFEEWKDKELQNAILMGNYYYQPSFLYELVQKKYKNGESIIKDPVTNKILSQEEIKKIFQANNKAVSKPTVFHFDSALMQIEVKTMYDVKPIPGDNSRWNFVQIFLKYNANQIKVSGGKSTSEKDKILIANIPMGISTTPGYNEVKSLDAASTSEALLVKVSNLISGGKIFIVKKNTQYTIKPCAVFQTSFRDWLNSGSKNHKRVNTQKPNGIYMKFLEKVNELES